MNHRQTPRTVKSFAPRKELSSAECSNFVLTPSLRSVGLPPGHQCGSAADGASVVRCVTLACRLGTAPNARDLSRPSPCRDLTHLHTRRPSSRPLKRCVVPERRHALHPVSREAFAPAGWDALPPRRYSRTPLGGSSLSPVVATAAVGGRTSRSPGVKQPPRGQRGHCPPALRLGRSGSVARPGRDEGPPRRFDTGPLRRWRPVHNPSKLRRATCCPLCGPTTRRSS